MDIFESFKQVANPEKAKTMSAYMKNNFPFLGIQTPQRRKLSKGFLNSMDKDQIDWLFIRRCWELDEREYQYLALDYLNMRKGLLKPIDLPKLKELIITKSWWDSIDVLDRIVGDLALRYPELNKSLLAWSLDSNIWLRRVAIDHQLLRKGKTNTDLLEKIIVNNFNQKDFFINKAIGWALRDYSKTNPAWVRDFIKRHRSFMATLSIKEASKYI